MQTETLNIFLIFFAGLNIVILIIALGVIWKYTKDIQVVGKYMGEIEKIREALTRQSEELASQRRLAVLPTFAASLKPDDSGSPIHRLYLKNVGNGIAMNIEVERIDFVGEESLGQNGLILRRTADGPISLGAVLPDS